MSSFVCVCVDVGLFEVILLHFGWNYFSCINDDDDDKVDDDDVEEGDDDNDDFI